MLNRKAQYEMGKNEFKRVNIKNVRVVISTT